MSQASPAVGRLRWLLWIAGVAAALVAIAWIALAVLFPPARLRTLVAQQASSALSRPVQFGRVSLGLWPPVRLTVERPALAEPGGFERGAAFQARSLHLDLDLFALLGRRIVVRRLALDEPVLHLIQRANGTTNLDGIGNPPAPGTRAAKPMDLAVRELAVHGGSVLVDDVKAARRTAFSLDTKTGFASERGGALLSTSGTTIVSGLVFGPLAAMRRSELNQGLAKLEWRIEHDGKFDATKKRLALGHLGLRLGGAELGLAGVMDDPGPRAWLDFRARGAGVDLGALLEYLSRADAKVVSGIKGSGRLDFDLALRGALGGPRPPDVTGTLSVRQGSFRYPGAAVGVEALAFTARFAPDSLGIGDLAARIQGQPVRARLAVTRFSDPMVWFAIQGNVDLAAVAPLAAPKDARLSGRAALDVSGRGRVKDPGAMALDGRAQLSGVSVQSPALPRKIENLEGDIRFSQSEASVTGFAARAGQSSFVLDGSVTRPLALMAKPGAVAPAVVDFTLRSPHLDLAELLPTTPGAPLAPNATGSGRVAIARLKSQRLDVTSVDARVALEPGVVGVPEYSMHGYGGTVTGSARFDLRDPAKPVFAVKAKADTVQADALLSAWTPVRGFVRGSLSTGIDLSGEGAAPEQVLSTLTAVGLALLSDGTLGPGPSLEALADFVKVPEIRQMKFRNLRLPFHVERGKIVTDPVQLSGPYGEWKLSGTIGFDGALDYAVSATLPREMLGSLSRQQAALAAGALGNEQGDLLVDLKLGGTAKAPRLAWDAKAMRDRLAGRASQALEAQRSKVEEELRSLATEQKKAAEDSVKRALERAGQRALADSALKLKAGDIIKSFFGTPKDTAKR